MDSSVTRIFAPFYSSAFSWNFALGMTQLLIPLYARELGYSGVEIGSLIALPIVVQMVFNLIGGAWTDRLGGMNISLVAFVATAAAGTMFAASRSEEHTSELQSQSNLVCRLLLEKKKKRTDTKQARCSIHNETRQCEAIGHHPDME